MLKRVLQDSVRASACEVSAQVVSSLMSRSLARRIVLNARSHQAGAARASASIDDISFLDKLHARLARTSHCDVLFWSDDGASFKVQAASHTSLLSWFGTSLLEFRHTLERLGFECHDDPRSKALIFAHSTFTKRTLPHATNALAECSRNSRINCTDRIKQVDRGAGETLRMPEVTYNPALHPLEVRIKCSGTASQSELWHVEVASSLKAAMSAHEKIASYVHQAEQVESDACTRIDDDEATDGGRQPQVDATDTGDDHEPESYTWANCPSEASSLGLDDLTDIDILSQISAYYG